MKHSVIFRLKYPKGSAEEKSFFEASAKLAALPGVKNFEMLKQVNKKNKYDYGISMEFADNELFEAYNNHPAHQQFIKDYWLRVVEEFLEIDYETMN